jgi:hypothetical protein
MKGLRRRRSRRQLRDQTLLLVASPNTPLEKDGAIRRLGNVDAASCGTQKLALGNAAAARTPAEWIRLVERRVAEHVVVAGRDLTAAYAVDDEEAVSLTCNEPFLRKPFTLTALLAGTNGLSIHPHV